MSEYFLHFPEVFLFRNCRSYPVLTLAVLPVPQSSLMKFAESLQEMINYHTVHCSHCRRVKPYVFFSSVFSSPYTAGGRWSSAGLTLCSRSLTVTRFLLLLGKAAAGRERGNGSVFLNGRRLEEGKWQNICRNVTVTLRKSIILCSWLCLLKLIGGFHKLEARFMVMWWGEKICTEVVFLFVWETNTRFLRWDRGSISPGLDPSQSRGKMWLSLLILSEAG